MAGLKLAAAAPTWPDINGSWLPGNIHSFGNRQFAGLSYLIDHPLVIHFMHRNLAYIITALLLVLTRRAFKTDGSRLFKQTRALPFVIVLLQVVLGILTILFSIEKNSFLWLAVAHQFVAMSLLLSFVWMIYIIRPATQR